VHRLCGCDVRQVSRPRQRVLMGRRWLKLWERNEHLLRSCTDRLGCSGIESVIVRIPVIVIGHSSRR
jgi:hypothetical protein